MAKNSARGLLYIGPQFYENFPIMLVTDDHIDYSEAKQALKVLLKTIQKLL